MLIWVALKMTSSASVLPSLVGLNVLVREESPGCPGSVCISQPQAEMNESRGALF